MKTESSKSRRYVLSLGVLLLAACADAPPPYVPKTATAELHAMPGGLPGSYVTVTPPVNCPDWSKPSETNYHQRPSSNLGCASANNVARMVADPRDLIAPASLAPSDAAGKEYLFKAYREGTAPALAEKAESVSGQ